MSEMSWLWPVVCEICTYRQIQILDRYLDGWTSTQIGDDLGIAPHTVRRLKQQAIARLRFYCNKVATGMA